MKFTLLSQRTTLLAVVILSLGTLQAQDPVETKDKLKTQDKLPAPDKLEARENNKENPKASGKFEAPSPAAEAKAPDKLQQKTAKPSKPGVKVAFLGVVLGSVDEALAAQLNLPEGTGVLVRAVMDDSPAAKAGLKEHDVLQYFNDQLLVNESQLETLVRQAGAGSQVKLTFLRGGKSDSVTAKLGEHELRDVVKAHPGLPGGKGPFSIKLPPGVNEKAFLQQHKEASEALEEDIREFRERIQKLKGNTEEIQREVERFRSRVQEKVGQLQPKGPKEAGNAANVEIKVLGDEGNHKGSTVATAISTSTDGNGNTVIIQKNSARTSWVNETGSGVIAVENGSKRLTARDKSGKEIFSGLVDTDEQRAKVPAELREQLERIEKSVKIEVRPAEPADAPKK